MAAAAGPVRLAVGQAAETMVEVVPAEIREKVKLGQAVAMELAMPAVSRGGAVVEAAAAEAVPVAQTVVV